jgi:hypothetical protein
MSTEATGFEPTSGGSVGEGSPFECPGLAFPSTPRLTGVEVVRARFRESCGVAVSDHNTAGLLPRRRQCLLALLEHRDSHQAAVFERVEMR